MKSRTLTCMTAMTLFAALAIPIPLAAQDNQDHKHKHKHHHYKLINMGTFGGPASFINPPFNVNPELSGRGVTAGASATAVSTTSTSNFFVCGGLDGLVPKVFHAFEWQDGAVLDLGALPPVHENCSNAEAVNNSGDIVAGVSENDNIDPVLGIKELRAVRWTNGHPKDLGTLGGSIGAAESLNERGQIAGFATNAVSDPYSIYYFLVFGSSNGTQTRAFLWDKENGMQDLGTLGTGNDALATLLNERGQVAGQAYTNSTPNSTTGFPTADPFLWTEDRGTIDLGTLGGAWGLPSALNNRGQVIGNSSLAADPGACLKPLPNPNCHPFLWEQGNLIDLYANAEGGNPLTADAINDAGEIVGAAAFQNESSDAYLWRKGTATDLGHLDGDCTSRAWAINSKSQVVAESYTCTGGNARAFLWENGSIVDLNTLIPPRSSLQLVWPTAINDREEIAGVGLPAGCHGFDFAGECGHAFLLIPCDEHHPGVEGCDYNLVDSATVPSGSSPVGNEASGRTLRQSLTRRISRYRFPGLAGVERN
jgi:probable HAF family extracellular repeat protein